MTRAGIEARRPDASEDEVRHLVRVAPLGKPLAETVYGRREGTP